jgi:hypothetical protein
MPRSGSSSSSDSPAASAKEIRNGSCWIVTFSEPVVIIEAPGPTLNEAPGSPRSALTTTYEWSRPNAAVGEKRTRTTSGERADTDTIPCVLRNTRALASRAGAGMAPIDDQPPKAGEATAAAKATAAT